ncbi:IS3 family transposase [Pseudonocardia alaniniphila]|uniref:IS3 family transposase n=3 Tax=Pseudonocardia alaniniphila TaxID=75291 RepID=A0ABS9TVA6_9PSEU|nr:IS3 family transposase [Pseudonocardia alaniniphila]MCH6172499.1 IS3 family transposase [Pseudonocardia alaniniphila]
MIYPVVRELAVDRIPVAVACRVLRVSTSGYYAWRDRPSPPRRRADRELTEIISTVHARSGRTYGSPRVHAELRHQHGLRIGRARVARLMRTHGLTGASAQRRHRPSTIRDPHATPAPDLVERDFTAAEPDQLWVSDITQHLTGEGWVYCAVILDVYSRRVIGWSIAEQARTELITDALTMACQRRHPTPGRTVFHSDHGAQYTSWAFTTQLAAAGLHASMGTVGDCYDNALAESFFATLQTELLDRRPWHHRRHLEQAIFEWIETWYNPRRRHSALDYHSPNDYEQTHTHAAPAA